MYCIYVPERMSKLPITADRLLRSLGATGRLTGFDYAVFMISGAGLADADQCLLALRRQGLHV